MTALRIATRSLRSRDLDARELMDDPDCDLAALRRTYAQFRLVNRAVAGWRRVYTRVLRPLLSATEPTTVLDIGFGGGDVPRALSVWARRDGLRLEVTAIDPDVWALDYVATRRPAPGVTFRRTDSGRLVAEGAVYDVVISNHVLHHLAPDELTGLLEDSRRLGRRLVVHNDIARSSWAYAAYAVASAAFAPGSFLRYDGLLSIRRSYRPRELEAVVGPGWQVRRQLPARLLLMAGPATSAPGSRR